MKRGPLDAAMTSILFRPACFGNLQLKNRMAMAPMTRARAGENGVPTSMMADYYDQRSTSGLIVTEGVHISPQARGFLRVPGIFDDAQESGWRMITERVHAAGSRLFMQLWHVGRVGHPENLGNGLHPVAPSAIAPDRTIVTASGTYQVPVPREMTGVEVSQTIADYASAARRALAAGCDGVEIHAANGYLPAQFLHESTNRRSDEWGGSLERRARFIMEATRACVRAIGAERVCVRLSPFVVFNGASSADDTAVYNYLLPQLAALGPIWLHVVTAEVLGGQSAERKEGATVPDVVGFARALWPHRLIAAGGFDRAKAELELSSGRADLIAFGRDFIGNPDLPARLEMGYQLTERRPADWYGDTEVGYIDYPCWTGTVSAAAVP